MPNQGYNHIALFTPLNASKPLWITAGEWEVTEISGLDSEKGLVYVPSPFSPSPLFHSTSPRLFDGLKKQFYANYASPWHCCSYFTAATPSIDRHIYSIPLSFSPNDNNDNNEGGGGMTALTDTTVPGYFQASFSPKAGYYVLGYKGPKVPWQRLIETGAGEDREPSQLSNRLFGTER